MCTGCNVGSWHEQKTEIVRHRRTGGADWRELAQELGELHLTPIEGEGAAFEYNLENK